MVIHYHLEKRQKYKQKLIQRQRQGQGQRQIQRKSQIHNYSHAQIRTRRAGDIDPLSPSGGQTIYRMMLSSFMCLGLLYLHLPQKNSENKL